MGHRERHGEWSMGHSTEELTAFASQTGDKGEISETRD